MAADSCLERSRSRAVVKVSLTWLTMMGLRRIEFAPACRACGNADVIADDGQGERPFRGLAFAGCGQQQCGFRLLVPVNNDDLKSLMGDFVDGGDCVRAVLSLYTETGQHLKNGRSRSLVRGKQKAAKGHALYRLGAASNCGKITVGAGKFASLATAQYMYRWVSHC